MFQASALLLLVGSLACPARHDERGGDKREGFLKGPGSNGEERERDNQTGACRGGERERESGGGGGEMAGRATATATAAGKDRSSFAVTCSLLSQFLKEKKGGGGGLQGLGLGLRPAPAAPPAAGAGGNKRLCSSCD